MYLKILLTILIISILFQSKLYIRILRLLLFRICLSDYLFLKEFPCHLRVKSSQLLSGRRRGSVCVCATMSSDTSTNVEVVKGQGFEVGPKYTNLAYIGEGAYGMVV